MTLGNRYDGFLGRRNDLKSVKRFYGYRPTALMLCRTMVATLLLPACAEAKVPGKIVRVGWYEIPFNKTDAFGWSSWLACLRRWRCCSCCFAISGRKEGQRETIPNLV